MPAEVWTVPIPPFDFCRKIMPTLKVARRQASAPTLRADFGSVWSVLDSKNISFDGQGLYSYIGEGGVEQEDVGLVKTNFPLDPCRMGGVSSYEVTLTDTGEQSCVFTACPS